MHTLFKTTVETGTFVTFAKALSTAGLNEILKGPGPFTVFAPTDEAFAKLPEGIMQDLLNDPQQLSEILTYHIIPGKISVEDILNMPNGSMIPTVEGQDILIENTEGVQINNAVVIQRNIMCTNGIIHAIDSVLMPDTEDLDFDTEE